MNKKSWKLIIFLALSMSIGLGVYFTWKHFQQPVRGKIKILESDAKKTTEEMVTFERYEGEHLSFRHKMSYILKESEKNPDANQIILEKAFFSESSVNSKKIVMLVEGLNGRTIDDSASFNLRKKFPKRFKEEKFAYGDIVGNSFLDTESDSFEKTFFIKKEKYLIVFSFSAPAGLGDDFGFEIEDVLRSIQF